MKTTLLNPTVWLLAGTFVSAVWGVVRGRDARASLDVVIRWATALPVLIVLVVLAGGGLASRAFLGFYSPGAYAEEVVAARGFLEGKRLYGGTPEQTSAWVADATTPIPWAALPGVSSCHADALGQRAAFYTGHAHTPMLLLAGVPIVGVLGGRGLYVTLLLTSALAIFAMAAVLTRLTGALPLSRHAVIIAAALGGWQPVLAAIKQGDAILPVAGIVTVVWFFARRSERIRWASLGAGAAAALALPAVGIVPALLCCWRRAGIGALVVLTLLVAVVTSVAGWQALTVFGAIAVDTGRVYTAAVTNYAVAPRLAALHAAPVLAILLISAVAALMWPPLREPDRAFALFLPLGMIMSPLLWSQHLALMLVPIVVLLIRVRRSGSSVELAAWSGLVLLLSLPDGAAAPLSRVVSLEGVPALPLSAVPVALAALWIWSTTGDSSRSAGVELPAAAGVAGAASLS